MSRIEQIKASMLSAGVSEDKIDGVVSLVDTMVNDINSVHKKDIDKAITKRDALSLELSTLKPLVGSIKEKYNLEDDFTIDDIDKVFKNENAVKDIEDKYLQKAKETEIEFAKFKDEIAVKDEKLATIAFSKAITDSGLMKSVYADKDSQDVVLKKLMAEAIFEDGNIYVKDDITGGKMIDSSTQKLADVNTLLDRVKKTTGANHFNPEIIANGGGAKSAQTPQGGSVEKIDTSKHTNVDSFMNEAFAEIKQG